MTSEYARATERTRGAGRRAARLKRRVLHARSCGGSHERSAAWAAGVLESAAGWGRVAAAGVLGLLLAEWIWWGT